ncbi:MAG: aminotransferase class I/II-fold pyridoxal phosphate-dependent enzyme, partial [Deltaproteobacteria bacterium]|nr:aminotransferase class I/II-fold pyridoxal phosphate-dependent enzyme [Deltaproteobacteria bacterium]
ISMASLPGMFERTITMSSYSKTFAITGWRIGFVAAPAEVADVLRVAFDQLYVCAPTPLQHGVATAIENVGDQYYASLKKEYLHKREMLLGALTKAGFAPNVPQGAYYILADTSTRYPGMCSQDVVEILINTIQVGAVPATDFIGSKYRNDATRNNFLRFSYAVGDDMLERAVQQLAKL